MKHRLIALASLCLFPLVGLAAEEGFTDLMDGKSFAGWKKSEENPETWKIEDGCFVASGPRSHLFYDAGDKPFRNFHLKVEVMTEPGSNGGIYFHSKYQKSGWPVTGFECQVNVSHSDWKKTGSLYDVVNVTRPGCQDNKWWQQEIIVEGQTVTVKIDGEVLFSYREPDGAKPGNPFTRKLAEGTFALQAHDPKSIVRYRNIRVKRLE